MLHPRPARLRNWPIINEWCNSCDVNSKRFCTIITWYCGTDSSWRSMCYCKLFHNCDRPSSMSDTSHERPFSIDLHHFKLTHRTDLIRTLSVNPRPGRRISGGNARLIATIWVSITRNPSTVCHRNTRQTIDCPIIAQETRWLIGCTKSTDPKSVPTLST